MGFLSIDPGVRGMAIARWDEGDILMSAWNTTIGVTGVPPVSAFVEAWSQPGNSAERVVGEKPVVYPGAKGLKTNPNDLLDLAMCAGAFYGMLVSRGARLRLVEPAEWKAQVPKEITRERIKAILTPQEISRIRKGGEMHNVWDAIGIGLFASGRAKRGMVR
jgi:hypothetical protein